MFFKGLFWNWFFLGPVFSLVFQDLDRSFWIWNGLSRYWMRCKESLFELLLQKFADYRNINSIMHHR